MKIIFTPTAPAINDYQIESFFQENKDKEEISISNQTLLTRFRLGVKNGECSKIKLITTDLDGTEHTSFSCEKGLMNVWNAEVLEINLNNTMNLI